MARSRSGSTSTFAEVRCKPTMRVVDDLAADLRCADCRSSEHDDVAHAARGLAHQRTLAAIAVAAAAEQRDDAAGGMQLARRGQQVAQRVVGVRVIHDHQERLAQVDALEAAGHGAEFANARLDDFARKAQSDCPRQWRRACCTR